MRALAETLFVVMPAAKTAKAATMVATLLTVIPFRLCRPAETSAQRDHPQIRCCEPSQIKQPVAMVTNPARPRILNDKIGFMMIIVALSKQNMLSVNESQVV
jgi:hypothetical protein